MTYEIKPEQYVSQGVTQDQVAQYNDSKRKRNNAMYNRDYFRQFEESVPEENKRRLDIGGVVVSIFANHVSKGFIDDLVGTLKQSIKTIKEEDSKSDIELTGIVKPILEPAG